MTKLLVCGWLQTGGGGRWPFTTCIFISANKVTYFHFQKYKFIFIYYLGELSKGGNWMVGCMNSSCSFHVQVYVTGTLYEYTSRHQKYLFWWFYFHLEELSKGGNYAAHTFYVLFFLKQHNRNSPHKNKQLTVRPITNYNNSHRNG